ncbi:hypothetical protein DMB44_02145 [Thermoplasma sp. Kam2015]|uniref:hypothetical protein n=1 Tax=Thermoplasma sp. Kam2015 TaxID=2094122 RepID=UPI000D9B5CE6|nr:hypothetical protein [Thermoplasma sp. Kam2015]PYB68703.1 hypothetical protein DMB44_02145 [Thermoplasma sp. Kam2015]
MTHTGLRSFRSEISRNVYDEAWLTVLAGKNHRRVHLIRDGRRIVVIDFNNEDFDVWRYISDSVSRVGYISAVLRSMTEEVHPKKKEPFMEVRGFLIYKKDSKIYWEMISAQDMMDAMQHDAVTGKKIKADPLDIYCGADGECLDYLGRSIVFVKKPSTVYK